MQSEYRYTTGRKKWIAAVLLLVIFLINLLQYFPRFVELVYGGGLYKAIGGFLRLIFGWLPFSLGDIIYGLVVIFLLVAFIRIVGLLVKRDFLRAGQVLLHLFIAVEIAFITFYLLWGINYSRPPAAQRLSLQDTAYTLQDVKAVTRMIIDSVNASEKQVTLADRVQRNDSIIINAISAVSKLQNTSALYCIFLPKVKASLLSPLMNYMGTSGYYNPFTGEAQVNIQMPVFDRPFTSCHEMAHQMGFAREDEANFVGYLAGVSSKDRLLKYAAYYEGSLQFLRYLRVRDTSVHKQLKALLSKGVRQDITIDSLYWTKYEGRFGDLSSRFYDSFLKANQQPAGLDTYNRMIKLTMAWYRRKLVNKSP